MSHGSARLTVHGRRLIVQRHHNGWKKAHIAAAMGVSRKCVTTWIDRYAAEGEDGLLTRSSRPHSMPTRTSAQVEAQVLQARRVHREGPGLLGPRVGVPARTVSRILARHGVPRLAVCDPMTGEVIRSSKSTAVRYERDRPGELVHVDVKKLGKIPEGGGWRAHGRSVQVRGRGNGYDFVHSMVDDHSRLAYSEIHDDEKAGTCAAFLTRAAAYFAAHGIDQIERVMTDNAMAYRHGQAFIDAVAALGARQKFIRAHCPWQNGKVERFNRTLQTEWAYRHVFTSNQARKEALDPWLNIYNTQRRHSALDGLPPTSRL
ncbi:IS481 family transposase [Kocuria sp. JC486]|uniref:IS481 family transposase n=3 Tax=Kocuria soli TaxID=2485125 RepID=A0A3N3ZLQ2_9MICC|nr:MULTISPECIES: IS481 family transposase [Kocuria]NHU86434.1 IS481 family transposase [Kocuria sp. JC486]ROZ61442.1 IS481 family transposase [Kocuria soli]